jgi:hypothetical protein
VQIVICISIRFGLGRSAKAHSATQLRRQRDTSATNWRRFLKISGGIADDPAGDFNRASDAASTVCVNSVSR